MLARPGAASDAADAGPSEHVADRLLDAVDRCAAPACVGLDPVLERLPAPYAGADARSAASVAEAFVSFSTMVLDAVADVVPCVKPQSACFERYGSAGVAALERVIDAASSRGLEVILDAKRGDIGISAEHYAHAARSADWVTINAYLGADGITPFLTPGHGAFALVRTSNPGGDALQARPVAGGRGGETVADAVADLVATLGHASIGARGYSSLGAVVGATKPDDAARLRARMPEQIFLVPGYGAQGAGADDVRACFDARGHGAVITASRSVIYAGSGGADDVGAAARRFADEVGRAAGLR